MHAQRLSGLRLHAVAVADRAVACLRWRLRGGPAFVRIRPQSRRAAGAAHQLADVAVHRRLRRGLRAGDDRAAGGVSAPPARRGDGADQ